MRREGIRHGCPPLEIAQDGSSQESDATTGALLGLDAVAASAEGNIHSVKMTTRKPPIGLKGAPYLVQNNISVDDETGEKLLTLMDTLNEHDDVQNVYANFDIPEEVLAALSG